MNRRCVCRGRKRDGGQCQALSWQGAGRDRWAEPERQTRAVKEYLAALEAEAEPNPDREPAKAISTSDPCAAWPAKANKRVQFGYGLNYLIDIENAVIVDVAAAPARNYDEDAATKNIERTDKRFGLKPKRLAAIRPTARASSSGGCLAPASRRTSRSGTKSARGDGTLSCADFRWDRRRDVYICSNNKVPHTSGTVHKDARLSRLQARLRPLSDQSALLSRATRTKDPGDVHEDAQDRARRLMQSKAFRKSRDERKRVEMRFAHLKSHHSFERMRLVRHHRNEGCLRIIVHFSVWVEAGRAVGPSLARSLPSGTCDELP